ncbi:MAG: DUF4139 domain-containing protein [Chthonomonas sp.]|nr:DUF4139 domain-containing protein [Chthonomonas sp.]
MQATTPQTSLTVYNGGFGLVKDVRVVELAAGRQTIPVPNVAAMIERDSVAVRSLSAPGSFEVMEQNFRYDLISPFAILQKSIGEEVTITQVLANGTVAREEGTLLSAPVNEALAATNTGVTIRLKNGGVLLNPPGTIEVKKLPGDLVSKPTLFWDLDADKAGANTVELSYLTGGLSWIANYVILLEDDGNSGSLKGWVTMNNTSGTSYVDCRLKLLAGEVNRSAPAKTPADAGRFLREYKMKDHDMQEEQFGEYHLYTLPRPATVLNNEMKQLSLLESPKIKIAKQIVFDPTLNYGSYRASEGEIGTGSIKPLVKYTIVNAKASGLGMPLPAGTVKLYQRDSEGATQLVGEDSIDHTPADERISLDVGRAFDIVAQRNRSSYKRIVSGKKTIGATETFVTELRNRKKVAETVTLIERFYGDWKVTESTEKYTKANANAIVFTVTLKPGEVRKLTYSVETRWGS